MVIDHIDASLFNRTMTNMWWIGRAAFPLFAYAVAVAILKSGEEKAPRYGWRHYGLKILLLAVLVEPVCRLTRDVPELNVLFTLGLGAAFAGATYRMKDFHVYLCHVLAAISVLLPSVVEFGLPGVLLPSALLMVLRGRKHAFFSLALLCLTLNLGNVFSAPIPAETTAQGLVIVALVAFTGVLCLPLMTLYVASEFSGKKRLLPKYALHVFYPAHLAIIWLFGHYVMHLP